MTTPARLGFAGAGRWGTMLAEATRRAGGATVVAGFSPTSTTRHIFAERFGCEAATSIDDLLSRDLDGVVVASPHSTHLDVVTAAADAGVHVFVEKPLTLSVASAQRAIAATEAAGVVLQVGHQRRRLGATRALRQLIDDGELGMVHLLEANLSVPANQTPGTGWKNDPAERPLGGMTGLGVHMIDNLQYLAGRATSVTALSKPLLASSALDDATMCIIEYAHGPLAHLATSMVIPKTASVAAFGTDGAAWSEEDGLRLYRQDTGATTRREVPVDAVDALAEQMGEFVTAIGGGAAPEVDGAAALEVVAVLEAAMRSVERRAAVDVDEVRPPRPT